MTAFVVEASQSVCADLPSSSLGFAAFGSDYGFADLSPCMLPRLPNAEDQSADP